MDFENLKSGSRRLINDLGDRLPRTGYEQIERAVNWLLIFNFGTILWVLSNFEKFIIKKTLSSGVIVNVLSDKPLFYLGFIFISVSLVCVAIYRFSIFIKHSLIYSALDKIQSTPIKLEFEYGAKEITEEDVHAKIDESYKEAVKQWALGHNWPSKFGKIFYAGLIFFSIGMLIYAVYFMRFVHIYL